MIEHMFGVGPVEQLSDAIAKLRVDEGDVDLVELRRELDRLEAEWVRRVRQFERSAPTARSPKRTPKRSRPRVPPLGPRRSLG